MSDSNNPYMVDVGEDYSESWPHKRSRLWDEKTSADTFTAMQNEQKLGEETQKQWIRLVSLGKWDSPEAQRLLPLVRQFQRVQALLQGKKLTTESDLLPGGVIAEPERTPNLTATSPDDANSKRRIRIPQNATVETVLVKLTDELEALHKRTLSQAQRIGIASAIRIIQRGVYVSD